MTKKLIPLLTLMCVALPTSRVLAQEKTLPELLKIMRPAVVFVTAYDTNNVKAWTGTGFFITDRILVTNYHMIDGAASLDVKLESGKVFPVSGVIAEDPESDLVKITVNATFADHGTITFAPKRADEGQRIAVLGNPKGLEKTLSDGIVSAYREDPNSPKRMQITAPISHGSSGSPVVNMAGQVVGVVTSTKESGQNLNFAATVDMIENLKNHEELSLSAWTARELAKLLSSPDGLYKLALKSYKNEEYEISEKMCEDALVKSPNNSKTWMLLSDNQVSLGKSVSAIMSANQAVKVDSASAETWDRLGDAYVNSKRLQEAIICYKHAIILDSLNDTYLDDLAVTLGEANRKAEAIATYHRAVRYGPENATALCNLGIAYNDAHDYTNAMRYLNEAAVAAPKWSKPHLILAYCYRDSGLYEEEKKEIAKALDIFPENFSAHMLLGRRYYYEKAYTSSLLEFGKCNKLDSTDQDELDFIGWTNVKLGDTKSAIQAFVSEERLYPKDVNTAMNVGYAYYLDSSFADAIRAYNRALKLDPTNQRAYNELALVFIAIHDYAQALESYKNALELDPDNAYTLSNVGDMCLKKKQYEDAAEYFESALRFKANYLWARSRLGIAYLHLAKKTEAITIYNSIKDLDPIDAKLLFAEIYPSKKP